ncbi:MAG TPA: hypothetical protein VFV02_15045 [Acidimicrobiales bacterium]|nr:hypothetical protein [Acidimicrobiales bacterium]
MPTTTENAGRSTSAGDDTSDALESVYQSLRTGEATGEEAIAETVHAFAELFRTAVPAAVSQPARFLDLSFEVVQQTLNFQRRLVFEVLSGFQRVMIDAWSDQLEGDRSFNVQGARSDRRVRTTRRAA